MNRLSLKWCKLIIISVFFSFCPTSTYAIQEQEPTLEARKIASSSTLGKARKRYIGDSLINVIYPNGHVSKYKIPVILTIDKPLVISLLNKRDKNPVYIRIEARPPGSIEKNPTYGKFLIETSTKIGPGINVSANQILRFWTVRVNGGVANATLINRHTERVVFTNFIWLPDLVLGHMVRIRFYERSTMTVRTVSNGANVTVKGKVTQAYVDPKTYRPVPVNLKVNMSMNLRPAK